MDSAIDFLGRLGFMNALWVFSAISVVHELEEWNISGFERRSFTGVPDVVNDRNARGVIAFISAAILLWCAAAALTGNPKTAAYVFIPAIEFMMVNALQHVYWTIRFRAYAPGVISATLLVLPIGFLLAVWAVVRGYAPIWYVLAWAVPYGWALVDTVRHGDRMMPIVRGVYAIGRRVATLLVGKEARR
jgi:hypothetical protein